MTPEEKLLLCCARKKLDPDSARQLKELTEVVDWEIVVKKAAYHKLLPLLFLNLKRCCPDLVPKPIWKRLKELYVSNGVINLFHTYNLIEITELFRKNHIQAVPFKGPTLSLYLFGTPALRTFVDLDILINQKDIGQAVSLLRSLGYKTKIDLSPSRLQVYARMEDDLLLYNQELLTVVELHWELSGRYLPKPLDLDMIGSRLGSISIKGHPVATLSDEDLLIYLCVHGSKHKWICLDLIICVAELIRAKPNLDWTHIFTFSKDIGAHRMVLIGLELACDLLGAHIPRTACEMIDNDPSTKKLVSQVKGILFQDKGEEQHLLGNRFAGWHLRCGDTVGNSARYALRLSFMPTIADWQWVNLPARLSFLYFLLRPARLISEFFKKNVGCRLF